MIYGRSLAKPSQISCLPTHGPKGNSCFAAIVRCPSRIDSHKAAIAKTQRTGMCLEDYLRF